MIAQLDQSFAFRRSLAPTWYCSIFDTGFQFSQGRILNRDPNSADLLNANKMRVPPFLYPYWRLIVTFAPRLISGDTFKAFRERFNPFQGVYVYAISASFTAADSSHLPIASPSNTPSSSPVRQTA